jgi:hypothetical protein
MKANVCDNEITIGGFSETTSEAVVAVAAAFEAYAEALSLFCQVVGKLGAPDVNGTVFNFVDKSESYGGSTNTVQE